ncbi:MAG: hypothetical protein ACKO0N_04605, partial [Planctomycetota bacterium]
MNRRGLFSCPGSLCVFALLATVVACSKPTDNAGKTGAQGAAASASAAPQKPIPVKLVRDEAGAWALTR